MLISVLGSGNTTKTKTDMLVFVEFILVDLFLGPKVLSTKIL